MFLFAIINHQLLTNGMCWNLFPFKALNRTSYLDMPYESEMKFHISDINYWVSNEFGLSVTQQLLINQQSEAVSRSFSFTLYDIKPKY
jgi:hypothetical protein